MLSAFLFSIALKKKKKKKKDQLLEKSDINILFRFSLSSGIWEMRYKSISFSVCSIKTDHR